MRNSKLLALMRSDTVHQQNSGVLLKRIHSFTRPFTTSLCEKTLQRYKTHCAYGTSSLTPHQILSSRLGVILGTCYKRSSHVLASRKQSGDVVMHQSSMGVPTISRATLSSRRSVDSESSEIDSMDLLERLALGKLNPETSIPSQNAGWLIRLANENGYLSWCRNVYIATVVAATIHIQDAVPYQKDVAFLFFFMAGLNLFSGTGSFIVNILYMHKKMHMSKLTALYYIAMSVIHIFLWLGAVAIYLGYVEDDEKESSQDEEGSKPKRR